MGRPAAIFRVCLINDNVKYFIFTSAMPNCSAINCVKLPMDRKMEGAQVYFFKFQISSFLIAEVNATRFLVGFRLRNID